MKCKYSCSSDNSSPFSHAWKESRLESGGSNLDAELATSCRHGQQILNKLTLMSISVRLCLQSLIISGDSRDCVRRVGLHAQLQSPHSAYNGAELHGAALGLEMRGERGNDSLSSQFSLSELTCWE